MSFKLLSRIAGFLLYAMLWMVGICTLFRLTVVPTIDSLRTVWQDSLVACPPTVRHNRSLIIFVWGGLGEGSGGCRNVVGTSVVRKRVS